MRLFLLSAVVLATCLPFITIVLLVAFFIGRFDAGSVETAGVRLLTTFVVGGVALAGALHANDWVAAKLEKMYGAWPPLPRRN